MGFTKKDEGINREDFTKLVDVLDTDKFGKELWQRLVDQTEIIINEKGEMDINSINEILAKYAKYHGWLIIEQERFIEMLDKTEIAFDMWYKEKYAEASRSVAKNTAANIEARVVEMCKEEATHAYETLVNEEGLTPEEAKHKLRFQGWGGRKTYIIELKAKTNMIKGFVKIWEKEVNALQTLSKNITSEMEIVRRNLE